ncbi:MAG: OmpA family protein [Ignavibacteriales bacterium]|nr:OmpA family protein [Ignavibacteriales bacterium]
MTGNSRNPEVPIIIRKKKGGHAAHHGGAWKVAYADFVTAMMALFIVLWIVGQSKQVKEYMAAYFKDPGAFSENTKGGGAFEFNKVAVGEHLMEENLKRQEEKLKEMGEKIMETMQKTPTLKELAKQIKIEITKEGMRIELVEQSNKVFFDVGTSHLKEDATKVLAIIAAELKAMTNHVVLEGHTDSRQYQSTDGYTNYELSADRANSARRILMKNGLEGARIDGVMGYADRHLRNPSDPFDVVNRRTSILVQYEKQGETKGKKNE